MNKIHYKFQGVTSFTLLASVGSGMLLAMPAQATLISGNDAGGFRLGAYNLQLGQGGLQFVGSSTADSASYDYSVQINTLAGTQASTAVFDGNVLLDGQTGFVSGNEMLSRQWQTGYMAYQSGGGGCDRYSCWSYPGYYYPVTTGSGTSGLMPLNGSAYLGFRFQDNGWHYGWAEVAVSNGAFDIGNWAFESSADIGVRTGSSLSLAPVQADLPASGDVPEPGTLALLALGAGGLAAFRRRR